MSLRRISGILLVDRRGWVLLQERDEHAPRAANQWGLPGGHVEEGESHDEAAYRELAEETGIDLAPDGLTLWRKEDFAYRDDSMSKTYCIYTARVDLTDEDIVVGEGRQIVFVAPDDVPALDKSESCAHFATQFLASPEYRQLVAEGVVG